MSKDIIRNILSLFIEKIITVFLVFYSEGMIARVLLPEQYGQWLYSVNFILLLSSLTLVIGAEVSVVSLARNRKISGQILISVFWGRMFFSIFAFLIAIIYANHFVENELIKKFIIVLSFFLIFSEPFGVVSNYFQANVNIFPVSVIRLMGLSIRTLTILICFHFFKDGYFLIPFSRIAEIVSIALLLIILIIKVKSNLKFNFDYKIFRIILFRGMKFWPALLFMYLFQRIDRFFIEHYFSYEVLSQYGIAVQLMEQGFLLLGIIIQSISPKLIYMKMSYTTLKNNIFKMLLIMMFISIVFFCFGYVLIPYLVQFIYGSQYVLASNIAQSMLVVLFLFGIDTVVMQYLYREKLAKVILAKWVILSLASIISYYMAFEYFETTSISVVYIINYTLMAVFSIFILVKRMKNEY